MRYLMLMAIVGCSTATAGEQDDCKAVFAREKACTDTFIPRLVDARRRLDKPSGVSKADRVELISVAQEEWAEDSQPKAVEKTCKRKLPEAQAKQAKSCLERVGCDAFLDCIMPVIESTL